MSIKNGIQWFEQFVFAADASSHSVAKPEFLTVAGVIAICAVLIFLGWLIDWLHRKRGIGKWQRRLSSFENKLTNLCLDKYGNLLAPYILTEYEMEQKKQLKLISEIEKGLQIFPKK